MVEQRDGLERRPPLELIGRLFAQIGDLVQNELSLAQIEMRTKLRALATVGVFGGVAAVLALLGSIALMIAAIAALSLVVSTWAAALIVMAVLFVFAAIFALVAKATLARATPLLPERALKSLGEDLTWAKTRFSSSEGYKTSAETSPERSTL